MKVGHALRIRVNISGVKLEIKHGRIFDKFTKWLGYSINLYIH